MTTYLFIHGAFTGGWAWRTVADDLRAAGRQVFAPTLTGAGERVHLASPEIGLETHILDVVNVLHFEDLSNVLLVGYSYGGVVATGVAERAPERLAQLIYLDAWIPQDGETAYRLLGSQLQAHFEQSLQSGDGWRIPPKPLLSERNTPTLARPWTESLAVQNPATAAIPRTYIHFTGKPAGDPLAPIMAGMADRARTAGWNYRELVAGHYAPLEQPHALAALLLGLA